MNICRSVASNFLHLCQLLVCSGKSQPSNFVNAHCFQILIWTWFMSYRVETTLCHDITTYDISLKWHSVMQIELPKRYNSPFFSLSVNVHTDMCDALILWLSCRLPDRGRELKTNYLCPGVMFQVHPHKCHCLLETICCKKMQYAQLCFSQMESPLTCHSPFSG